MQREQSLAIGIVVLLVAIIATPLVVPGVMEHIDDGDDFRPSQLRLQEEDATIEVLSVPGRTATLQLDTRLSNRGGTAENVTVEVRAIDADTGLLVDQQQSSVGDIEGGQSTSILSNVTVERQGGYRIETIVYEDGDRVARATRRIDGVEALTPEYADSPVTFERFETAGTALPSITYSVDSVSNNRTTMTVSAYLTNTGDETAGDVTVVLRARQAESNVIADSTERQVGSVRPGRTVSPSSTLTVPDGYNYWLDAILLKDGVVIGSASEPAHLNPRETLERNETQQEVEFDSGDFEETEQSDREFEATNAYEDGRTTASDGPGFGIVAALVGLLAAALLTARRKTND